LDGKSTIFFQNGPKLKNKQIFSEKNLTVFGRGPRLGRHPRGPPRLSTPLGIVLLF